MTVRKPGQSLLCLLDFEVFSQELSGKREEIDLNYFLFLIEDMNRE